MATLTYALNVSLDGYVDHDKFTPDAVVFRHFIDHARGLAGSLYGTRMYGLMRYWDEDDASWGEAERDFAAAWRGQKKWVVSSTLGSVGPNAELVTDGLEAVVRRLKAGPAGEIEVAGPVLAQGLTDLGLIDEYHLYLHPVVLGAGNPYFQAARPPLRLLGSERIGEQVIRLRYASA